MQTLTRECPSDHLHGYPQVHPAKAGMQLLGQPLEMRLLYARLSFHCHYIQRRHAL